MNKPKYVAFSTQKGGAGKTTLTVLTASYLQYVKGYNVGIIDCDFPQYSIHDMRKRELDAAVRNDYYKVQTFELLKRMKRNFYPVECCLPVNAIPTAKTLSRDYGDLDFLFFDFPGTVNNKDVIDTIARMDYIFTPITADRVVMESSITFATVINEQLILSGKSHIKALYLLWNMVDGREKTSLYEIYEKVCAQCGLHILKTFIPDSKRFRKEVETDRASVFRSTTLPPDKSLIRGSNIDSLVEEILELIQS
ncbi:ParA family protein [Prevotella sp. kh1p2]|uniref:ParA family protein n=1 Tax=Prevotella sp. kh1p2 TaxID=1761883 RepID=UPI0008D2D696|nr:ParA family protein [Prevotella sp. kh1p2]SES78779.1 Cellulose biosynthesis protein BcsQ [Prevotella sp. kh1p2]SNU10629.1 Cellulose biosynthesis protein BcsQ [Prevotellaceae bacterium KH2P17]